MPTSVTTPRRRGAGARLDVDTIVAAALAVADRHGLAGLTMRSVGAELGADPTAVYRYFASKDQLVVAMADRLIAGMVRPPLPDGWRDRLHQVLVSGRRVYRAHPTIVPAIAAQAEDTPGVITANEVVVGCLRDAGLDDADVGRFHQVIVSFMIGTGVHEAAWGEPADDDVHRRAARRAYGAIEPETAPNCVALAADLFPPADDVFELAVGVLLDAIEATAARRTDPR